MSDRPRFYEWDDVTEYLDQVEKDRDEAIQRAETAEAKIRDLRFRIMGFLYRDAFEEELARGVRSNSGQLWKLVQDNDAEKSGTQKETRVE